MKHFIDCQTPLGQIVIGEKDNAITNLFLPEHPVPKEGYYQQEIPLLLEAVHQLQEYFAGRRQVFTLPLAPEGTPFQQAVWQALLKIPYGQARSYKDIAKETGNPKACRAVGYAVGQNPIAVLIPCHRVISSNQALTGYSGGLQLKEALLDLEHISYKK